MLRPHALLALVLVACRGKDGPATPPDAAPAAPDAAPAAPRPTTNLLVTTPAELTLSSRVDNPRDFPEHLVDGKRDTAWNGRTGDLGAWIEVKLDPRVHVTAFALTPGFDKRDLFAKNHRIRTLRIERDGVVVQPEARLDPDDRRMQRIPIDGPGGTYRLTVTSTVPGTEKAWKEIVVSDLEVLGEAPDDLRLPAPRLPKVSVAPGSAPPPKRAESVWDVKIAGRRGTSPEDVCASWTREVLAVVRAQPGMYEEVKCRPIAPPPVEGPLPAGWKRAAAIQRNFFDGVALKEDKDLVFELEGGAWIGGPTYSTWNDIGDSPSPLRARIALRGSRLVAATKTFMASWPIPLGDGGLANDGGMLEHEGLTCLLGAGTLACDELPVRYAAKRITEAEVEAARKGTDVVLPELDGSGKIVPLAPRD